MFKKMYFYVWWSITGLTYLKLWKNTFGNIYADDIKEEATIEDVEELYNKLTDNYLMAVKCNVNLKTRKQILTGIELYQEMLAEYKFRMTV